MKLTMKIKPRVMEAKTKDALDRQIAARFGTNFVFNSKTGNCLYRNDGARIGINYQKFRSKYKHGDRIRVGNPAKKRHATKIRDSKWIAYVYVFSKDMPIIVNQNTRTVKVHFDTKIFKV